MRIVDDISGISQFFELCADGLQASRPWDARCASEKRERAASICPCLNHLKDNQGRQVVLLECGSGEA